MANIIKRLNFDPIGGASSAAGVSYDNTTSGLAGDTVQEVIDELDVSVDTLITDVTSHETRIDTAESDITAIETAATALTTRVGTAETDINNLETDVAALDTRLDTAETDITAIETAATSLTTRVTTAEGEIDQLQIDVIAAQGDATQALADAAAAQSTADTALTNAATADGKAVAAQADIDVHIADATAAHASSAVSYDTTGTEIAATNVQDAITEIDGRIKSSASDLEEASFSLANNQVIAANITGFEFSSARSFHALVSVEVTATAPVFAEYEIKGIQKETNWHISITELGDNTGIEFDITSGGQVTYTGPDYAGFVSGTIKFRAITTSE